MDNHLEKAEVDTSASHKVLMYPNNNLGEQLRDFNEGDDVIDVVRKTFFPES